MSRLIIPGWHGSEQGHWQRHWTDVDGDAEFVEQDDWEAPELEAWIERLDKAVRRSPHSTLIAHSLGVILVAHYASRHPHAPIAGALLVAPPDVDALPGDHALAGFAPVPLDPLPFPSVIAISRNDPYIRPARGQHLARGWGADFVDLGRVGHVNVESGHGPWPQGFELAARISTGLPRVCAA